MSKDISISDLQSGDCIVDNPREKPVIVLEKPSCHTDDWATVLGVIDLNGVENYKERKGYTTVEIISRIADPSTGEEIFF